MWRNVVPTGTQVTWGGEGLVSPVGSANWQMPRELTFCFAGLHPFQMPVDITNMWRGYRVQT